LAHRVEPFHFSSRYLGRGEELSAQVSAAFCRVNCISGHS
jgi:hypothetical protein